MLFKSLQWRHNECDGVSNHQPHHCLLNGLFRRRSKKTSKLRVTCLCEGNSPVTGEFPVRRASNAENVSIWWRHNGQKGLFFGSFCLFICISLSSYIIYWPSKIIFLRLNGFLHVIYHMKTLSILLAHCERNPSPSNSTDKGSISWCWMLSLFLVWTSCWTNNRRFETQWRSCDVIVFIQHIW